MSKRYGRNQKRAHRTRIAELEAQLAKVQKNHDSLWRANGELSDEIACAKRIVGEYCVAFEPRIMAMRMGYTQFVEVMQYEHEFGGNVSRYWDFNPNEMLAPIHMNRIRLPILCVLADREHIRGSRHMNIVYDNKAWGYAIDPMAWRMSRYPKELCRNIAERLTNMIYDEMLKDDAAAQPRTHTRAEPYPMNRMPTFAAELPPFLR